MLQFKQVNYYNLRKEEHRKQKNEKRHNKNR